MNIEEEIARAIGNARADDDYDLGEFIGDRPLAAALMPLVKRAQAEAWTEGANAASEGYDLPDVAQIHNPYIEPEQPAEPPQTEFYEVMGGQGLRHREEPHESPGRSGARQVRPGLHARRSGQPADADQ